MMPLRRAVLVVMGKVSISLPVFDVLPDGKSRQSVHLNAQKWIIKTVCVTIKIGFVELSDYLGGNGRNPVMRNRMNAPS